MIEKLMTGTLTSTQSLCAMFLPSMHLNFEVTKDGHDFAGFPVNDTQINHDIYLHPVRTCICIVSYRKALDLTVWLRI